MEKLKSLQNYHPVFVIFTFIMTLVVSITDTYAQVGVEDATYQVAVLQYRGGGDWYSNPTSLPNLIRFCNTELSMNIDEEMVYVEVNSPDLSLYPFVHMTGHGNVVFSSSEARNLRNYLLAGGFLHISDNYGMDAFVRKEFLKVFPKLDWVEVPFSHPVYHQTFDFDQGLPKVHEHDDLPPRGLGLFFEGRDADAAGGDSRRSEAAAGRR